MKSQKNKEVNMKGITLSIVLFISITMLSACCTDDMCNMGETYTSVKTCDSCSTCSTCGYDASYSYSGWY